MKRIPSLPLLCTLGALAWAQPGAEATMEVIVFQLESIAAPATNTSEWLAAMLDNPQTRVLGRSRLHLAPGEKAVMTAGNPQPATAGCPAREPDSSSELGVEVALMSASEDIVSVQMSIATTFVDLGCVAQPVFGRNVANLRLRSGATNVIRHGSYLVALIPTIHPDAVR